MIVRRLGCLLGFMSAAWAFAQAPPPGGGTDAGKWVVRPGGRGLEPVRADEPGIPGTTGPTDADEKAGFYVIRPGGKGLAPFAGSGRPSPVSRPAPNPTLTTPSQPPASSVPASPGVLPVPPPPDVPPPPEAKDEKPLFDYWFALGIDGKRAGYVHWSAKEVTRKDKTFAVAVRYLNLTVSRFGNVVTQWGEESTVETADGQVLITSMRQGLGKDQALSLTGTVEGKTLRIKGEGAAAGAGDTPWPGDVVGLAREPKLFRDVPPKPGGTLRYPSYIPSINRVVTTTLTFEGEERRALWPGTPERRLLRFQARADPIGTVKLPASTTWVDAETYEPLMMEVDFPSLGDRLTFLRTTREAALVPVTRPVELFNVQSIRLNREIPNVHNRSAIIYKVSVPRDDDPGSVFASDARQQVKNVDPKARTLELHVAARRGPAPAAPAEPEPGPEYRGSSFFINWDNDLVKAHAAQAVAGLPPGADEWDKAVAVERWVRANMKAFEFTQAMATADNVAKTLSGDCTEYAMLAAAMCRALGIPSRTALGLVYAPGPGGKPYLAYHMWTEVYAKGQWLPLDATLGLGGVGPGHVKISDHSWHEEKTFAPLLPVLRALTARPTFEVLEVRP